MRNNRLLPYDTKHIALKHPAPPIVLIGRLLQYWVFFCNMNVIFDENY